MKRILWSEEELKRIEETGTVCFEVAEAAMIRSKLSFDDIEEINDHYENHKWGSDADRRYRKSAVNKAILRVAANASKFV